MRPTRLLLFFSLITLASFSLAHAAEETSSKKPPVKRQSTRDLPVGDIFSTDASQIESVADSLEYDKNSKKVIAKGNVLIRYQSTYMTADYGEVETETKRVFAKGHVVIFDNEQPIAKGEAVYFDFANHTGSFPDGRAIAPPWFITGKDIQQVKQGVKVIKDGVVTTCNLEKPHFEIKFKEATIHEGSKIVARNIRIYALGKPIFWWPYLVLPLQQQTLPFAVNTGYNSRHGYYIETSKGFSITKEIYGKWHADWRSKRGVGGGADLDYNFGPRATGRIKGYITQDKRGPTPGGQDPYRESQNEARGRITWLHRTDIDPYTNIILRYNRMADEFFLSDFFRKESQAEFEPQSFITLTKNSENYGFFTHVEKKVNSFESTVEKLPEAQLDWKTQPVLGSRVFYDGQLSYASLNKTFKRSDFDTHANRYDSFNELSLPLKWKEIKFTPFTNLRGTHYTRSIGEGQEFRTVFGGGADLRTQFYKTYAASSDKFGIEINQLRHVVEPVVRYETRKPTVNTGKLEHFDVIDKVDDADIVTFGLENRLQTKRVVNGQMRRVDFVSLNTYMSYQRREDDGDYVSNLTTTFEGQTNSNLLRHAAILSQEVTLRPYEWMQYEFRMDYETRTNKVRALNQDIVWTFSPLKFLFGHRFINDIANFEGGNQFAFQTEWVINPLWTVVGYVRWDIERKGRDEYQIMASRDLHDFILDLGYNVRNSQVDSSNKELFFNFRMKAFPQYALRSGARASLSEPRIGETVAGSNQAPAEFYAFEQSAPTGAPASAA